MALSAGHRLGPYEVLAPLGAGGMGEVYKARDTRLDRTVALKVIQPAAASSPDMHERFKREARAISALDHPNICMLHDVCREPANGAGEPVSFLVMQYLEGETLADRLARGGNPIPFETALQWAAEIARALDAAHRRGIVHRDLKPGNVMITKTGTKLLDFGLAKLAAGESDVAGFRDAETRTTPVGGAEGGFLTSRGAILGTLHYMSPEQLEGGNVDSRSDIFSFGVLLFEMLAGRRAFAGQSEAGVIAAILGAKAPAIDALADANANLPVVARRALDRVLARCLAKNPDDRWQSAADLAAELQWINEERLRPTPGSSAVPAAARASRAREYLALAVAAVAIVALAVVSYLWYPRPAIAPPPITFTIEAPEGGDWGNVAGSLGISPDGRLILFMTGTADERQPWLRDLGSQTSRRIDRASTVWHPFWSPDSKAVAYTTAASLSLYRLDLSGGAPMTLADRVAFDRGAWNQSGVILFSGGEQDPRLFRISEAGGQPMLAMDLDASREEISLSWPMFLPDGRRYLFVGRSADSAKTALFLASLDAPGRTLLVPAHSNVDYAAGHLFYQRDGTLMAHPFDATAGRLTAEAFPVIEEIAYNPGNGRGAFAVSATGTLVYQSGTRLQLAENRTLMLFDRAGRRLRQIGPPGPYVLPAFSPDGRRAVITHQESEQANSLTLWLLDIDRGVETRFTVGDPDERNPVWSPDGAFIAFQLQRRGDEPGIYRRSAGGGATTSELIVKGPGFPTGFSPDGQLMLMSRAGRIWMVPTSGDRSPVELFPGGEGNQTAALFSPDGKWIAYQASSANVPNVFVRPYPVDDRLIRVSPSSGRHPIWTEDGRHIVYRTIDDVLMSVELTPENGSLRAGSPVRLFSQPRQGGNQSWFGMDPRGERFLLILPPEKPPDETTPPITVIVNFAQSVGKKK